MNQTGKDEIDEQLKQLALVAQQHPLLTRERQMALRQLVNQILQSGRLCRPQSGQFSGVYQDIYDDALQELLLYICQNIQKYDPERAGVMAWVNMLLERRFFKEAIPRILDKQGIKRMDLSDLDKLTSSEKAENLTDILKECIELDPENLSISGETLQEVQSRSQDNYIQLKRFRGLSGEGFNIQVTLGNATIRETFVI